ncbi:MAG: NAD-dependent dehydratase, partial [Rhizobiaceae bacterium]
LTPGEIVAAFRAGLHRRPGLFRAPPFILSAALAALGRSGDRDRLFASVTVDSSGLRELGWKPVGDTPAMLAALAAGG